MSEKPRRPALGGRPGCRELLSGLATTAEVDRATDPRSLGKGLDEKTAALVRIAALVATGAVPTSFRVQIARATAAGATAEEVLATLVLVSTTVGMAYTVAATPGVALGLGYDIEAAFEDAHKRPGRQE